MSDAVQDAVTRLDRSELEGLVRAVLGVLFWDDSANDGLGGWNSDKEWDSATPADIAEQLPKLLVVAVDAEHTALQSRKS